MEPTLQPCPFCGAAGSLVDDGNGLHFVECSNLVDCAEWPMTHRHTGPEIAAAA